MRPSVGLESLWNLVRSRGAFVSLLLVACTAACSDDGTGGADEHDDDEEIVSGSRELGLIEGRIVDVDVWDFARDPSASIRTDKSALTFASGFLPTLLNACVASEVKALTGTPCNLTNALWRSTDSARTLVGLTCAAHWALATAETLRPIYVGDTWVDDKQRSGGIVKYSIRPPSANDAASWALLAAELYREAAIVATSTLDTARCATPSWDVTGSSGQMSAGRDYVPALLADSLLSMEEAASKAQKLVTAAAAARGSVSNDVQLTRIETWRARQNSRLEAASIYVGVPARMYENAKYVPLFEMRNGNDRYATSAPELAPAGYLREKQIGWLYAPRVSPSLDARPISTWATTTAPVTYRTTDAYAPGTVVSGYTFVRVEGYASNVSGTDRVAVAEYTSSGTPADLAYTLTSAVPSGYTLSRNPLLFVFSKVPSAPGAYPVVTALSNSDGDLRAEKLLRSTRVDPRISSMRTTTALANDLLAAMNEDHDGAFARHTAGGGVAFLGTLNITAAELERAALRILQQGAVLGRPITTDLTVPNGRVARVLGTSLDDSVVEPAYLYALTEGNLEFTQAAFASNGYHSIFTPTAPLFFRTSEAYARGGIFNTVEFFQDTLPNMLTGTLTDSAKGMLRGLGSWGDTIVRGHAAVRILPDSTDRGLTSELEIWMLDRVAGRLTGQQARDRYDVWLGEEGLACARSATPSECAGKYKVAETVWLVHSDSSPDVVGLGQAGVPNLRVRAADLPVGYPRQACGPSNAPLACLPPGVRLYVTETDASTRRVSALLGWTVPPKDGVIGPFANYVNRLVPLLGPGLSAALSGALAADAREPEKSAMSCAGVPLSEKVVLEDELIDVNTQDSYEQSVLYYLEQAKGAADEADQIGQELIQQGLSMDIRAEGAAAELEKLCGGVINVGRLEELACSTRFNCNLSALLTQATPEDLAALGSAQSEVEGLKQCLGLVSPKPITAAIGNAELCVWQLKPQANEARVPPLVCPVTYNAMLQANVALPVCADLPREPVLRPAGGCATVKEYQTKVTLAFDNPSLAAGAVGFIEVKDKLELSITKVPMPPPNTDTGVGCAPLLRLRDKMEGRSRATMDALAETPWLSHASMRTVAQRIGYKEDFMGFPTITLDGRPWLAVGDMVNGPIDPRGEPNVMNVREPVWPAAAHDKSVVAGKAEAALCSATSGALAEKRSLLCGGFAGVPSTCPGTGPCSDSARRQFARAHVETLAPRLKAAVRALKGVTGASWDNYYERVFTPTYLKTKGDVAATTSGSSGYLSIDAAFGNNQLMGSGLPLWHPYHAGNSYMRNPVDGVYCEAQSGVSWDNALCWTLRSGEPFFTETKLRTTSEQPVAPIKWWEGSAALWMPPEMCTFDIHSAGVTLTVQNANLRGCGQMVELLKGNSNSKEISRKQPVDRGNVCDAKKVEPKLTCPYTSKGTLPCGYVACAPTDSPCKMFLIGPDQVFMREDWNETGKLSDYGQDGLNPNNGFGYPPTSLIFADGVPLIEWKQTMVAPSGTPTWRKWCEKTVREHPPSDLDEDFLNWACRTNYFSFLPGDKTYSCWYMGGGTAAQWESYGNTLAQLQLPVQPKPANAMQHLLDWYQDTCPGKDFLGEGDQLCSGESCNTGEVEEPYLPPGSPPTLEIAEICSVRAKQGTAGPTLNYRGVLDALDLTCAVHQTDGGAGGCDPLLKEQPKLNTLSDFGEVRERLHCAADKVETNLQKMYLMDVPADVVADLRSGAVSGTWPQHRGAYGETVAELVGLLHQAIGYRDAMVQQIRDLGNVYALSATEIAALDLQGQQEDLDLVIGRLQEQIAKDQSLATNIQQRMENARLQQAVANAGLQCELAKAAALPTITETVSILPSISISTSPGMIKASHEACDSVDRQKVTFGEIRERSDSLFGAQAGIDAANIDIAKLVQDRTRLGQDITEEEKRKVLLHLSDRVTEKIDGLNDAWNGLRETYASIHGALARLDGQRNAARRLAAKTLMLDHDDVGRQFQVNTAMRARFNTLQVRYGNARDRAVRAAYLARRAVEQKLGVDLSTLDEEFGAVPPPSSWADKMCALRGVDYSKLRGVTPTQATELKKGVAYEFIGDYVSLLHDFVGAYRQERPFSSGSDTMVVSLRDELLDVRTSCDVEGPNLLYWSQDPAASDLGRYPNSPPWEGTCLGGSCVQARSAAGGGLAAQSPFACDKTMRGGEAVARCRALQGVAASELSVVPQVRPTVAPITDGLALYLDAAQIIASEGQRLNAWTSFSGEGSAVTASNCTGACLPSYRATALNGEPAVELSGAPNGYLDMGSAGAASEYTLTFVYSAVTDSGGDFVFSGYDQPVPTGGVALAVNAYGSYTQIQLNARNQAGNDQAATANNHPPLGAVNVLTVRATATGTGNAQIWLDGVKQAQMTLANVSTTLGGLLGKSSAGSSVSPAQFRYGSILLYERALSDTELDTLHTSLGARYGVPMLGVRDGLTTWMRADACGSGTDLCEDLSSSGHDVWCTVGNCPTITSKSIGGRPALDFVSSAATQQRVNGSEAMNESFTVSMVVRWNNTSPGASYFWVYDQYFDDASRDRSTIYAYPSGVYAEQHEDYPNRGTLNSVRGTLVAGRPALLTWRVTPYRGSEVLIDGVIVGRSTSPVLATQLLGAIGSGSGIAIGEALFYERDLEDAELDLVHAYLAKRYQITRAGTLVPAPTLPPVSSADERPAFSAAQLRQVVDLDSGPYWLSWYEKGTCAAQGNTLVPWLTAPSELPTALTQIVCEDATTARWLAPGWVRRYASIDLRVPGLTGIGFAPVAGNPAPGSVWLAAPQLHFRERNYSSAPLPYFPTDQDLSAPLGRCEDTTGLEFRSGRFHREGDEVYCAAGGDACATGSTTAPRPRRRYREFKFSISQGAIESGRIVQQGGFAKGNFNYRLDELAVNAVGTGVLDCAGSSQSCYASNFLQYSLIHDGPFHVRNYDGDTYEAPLYPGRIQSAKALAAERIIRNPIADSDQNLLADFYRTELRGRPLDGNYRLRIYQSEALDWEALEDIQLVVRYRYWTRTGSDQRGGK